MDTLSPPDPGHDGEELRGDGDVVAECTDLEAEQTADSPPGPDTDTGLDAVQEVEFPEVVTPDAQESVDCIAACTGVECGPVGSCDCGGCADEEECSADGKCGPQLGECEKSCLEAEYKCGELNSQCNCGTCDEGMICVDHECIEDPCPMLCQGKECGVVGAWYLGQSCFCGACDPGEACDPWTYTCKCLPICKDPVSLLPFECGDDLCGGFCGTCDGGLVCSAEHECVAPEENP